MAVFTTVSQDELAHLLGHYAVGQLVDHQGIASGIENTNYFVTTTEGHFVLTLFERLSDDALVFYLDLMHHLASHGIPCPRPIANEDDAFLVTLNGKPASLVSRLSGTSNMNPDAAHCAKVGGMLASMHLAARTFKGTLENPRGPHWWARTAPRVLPFLPDDERTMLQAEMHFQASHRKDALPRGVVHADLFRDNVLFDGPEIGGVIDFYFAGVDAWMYDLAVTVNDWCMRPDATLDPERTRALLERYCATRVPTEVERRDWGVMLRAAALRFWLSRLDDFHLPRPGAIIHPHDPNHFKRILESHIRNAPVWPLP